MRHRKAGKQLSRNVSHRRALLRNMVTSLFKYESIETTDAKAKSIRPVAERMITLAKRGDLHARRQALSYIQEKSVTHKLFGELKDRYLDRQGGYIRIVKKGIRKGDGAPVSIVQLIPAGEERKTAKKKSRKPKRVTRPETLQTSKNAPEEKPALSVEEFPDRSTGESETVPEMGAQDQAVEKEEGEDTGKTPGDGSPGTGETPTDKTSGQDGNGEETEKDT